MGGSSNHLLNSNLNPSLSTLLPVYIGIFYRLRYPSVHAFGYLNIIFDYKLSFFSDSVLSSCLDLSI